MRIERKVFSGVMNLDDPNEAIPGGHHKESKNIVFRGNPGQFTAQSALGNRLVTNAALPATGTNSCIGSHYDQQKKRLFYFNYNSLGNHGIYIYNTLTDSVSTLFLNNTHAATDVLGFDINVPITSINIIYGDIYASDNGGDILVWVDSLGRPSKLNIDRKLANVYASYQRSFLDVAKAPPVMPIQCVYENDLLVTNNNLKGKLFQFIYRWVYDDGEKSVWSTGSAVPLPLFSNDIDVNANPQKNSRINVYFATGDATVREIEIAVRIGENNITSDYGFVTTIKKTDIVGPVNKDNIIWNYLFYNNTPILPLDKPEQALLFDYVPQKANSQELLNGNTLIYGGITEGYDNPSITSTASMMNPFLVNSFLGNINGLLFFASQAGRLSYGNSTTIEVYLTGAGTNDAITNLVTNIDVAQGAEFKIQIGSNLVEYNNAATTSVSDILGNLATSAQSFGYTTTVVGNKLTITDAGISNQLRASYALSDINDTPYATGSAYKKNVISSLSNSSNYKYGIVYYDEKGRTNGVVDSEGLKITTSRRTSDTNLVATQINISSTPPIWANYYHIVRTNNLTYDKNIFWVTNHAFFTTVSNDASGVEQKVIYLGIGNMVDYNENIQSNSAYIGYDYTPGDRVKFIGRFDFDSTQTYFDANDVADFEITGVETNPKVEGVVIPGTFIKIKNPTNNYGSQIVFFGPNQTGLISPYAKPVESYRNYNIQIYNYKASGVENDFYYEISEQYGIENPGQASRYHIGRIQTQTASVPAINRIYQGDMFHRYRNVPVGANFTFTAGQYGQGDSFGAYAGRYRNININVWNADNTTKTINNTYYEIKSQVLGGSTTSLVATDYPNYSTADYLFYNKTAGNQTIRIRGSLPVSCVDSKANYIAIHAKIVLNGTTATIFPVLKRVPVTEANRQYEFDFDAKITVPTQAKVFLMTETHDDVGFKVNIGAFTINLNIIRNAQIGIIEKYFSDDAMYRLTNSSRPLLKDENAKNGYYPTLVRYSLPRQAGTMVNDTNRFFPANMDEYDRQKGDIVRLKVRGSRMRVFQDRGCGMVGVLQNMLFNADGSANLIQTNQIINTISYYSGEYGIGWLGTSLTSSGEVDYFVDPVRGYQIRISNDGITPISAIYKAQYYMTNLATKYVAPVNGTLGGKAKVLGTYDFNEEEYIAVFQGYAGQSNTTLTFSEKRNSYISFYDFAPEWISSVEGKIVSFKNGGLWVHDSTTYCNYYGVQYKPSIKVVFNQNEILKNRFNTITMLCNKVWAPDTNGDITTNLGQSSSLQPTDFKFKDDKLHASFMRDASSTGGLYNGNVLKGNWLQINLKPVNGNEFVNLYYIDITTLEPFNNR